MSKTIDFVRVFPGTTFMILWLITVFSYYLV